MPRKTALRAVGPDEAPPRKKTLSEAIDSGDYLEILVAQRRDIALSIPEERGPAKAALHRQLSLVSKEIESLRVKDAEDVEFGYDEAEDFDAAAI